MVSFPKLLYTILLTWILLPSKHHLMLFQSYALANSSISIYVYFFSFDNYYVELVPVSKLYII